MSHLRLLAAFSETAQVGAAADMLGITQPAASRMLAEIERITGHKMHIRSGRGVELTEVGRVLAGRAARIMMEMRDAAREIEGFGQGEMGRVAIGAVTAPALDLVLPAVRNARLSHPDVQIDVTVTSSDILFDQLLAGKLDFAIARVPAGGDASLVESQEIAPEPVALIARKGHPLAQLSRVTMADLMPYDWVMPGGDSPLTAAVLARLAVLGHTKPQQRMTTASFLLTLSLLQQSNAIAPLAAAVAKQFAEDEDSPFAWLRADFGIEVAPYSLIRRKGALLPAAAQHILGIITASIKRL